MKGIGLVAKRRPKSRRAREKEQRQKGGEGEEQVCTGAHKRAK
jgi:hypothetical protein